jgi:hypothetical protein
VVFQLSGMMTEGRWPARRFAGVRRGGQRLSGAGTFYATCPVTAFTRTQAITSGFPTIGSQRDCEDRAYSLKAIAYLDLRPIIMYADR